MTSTVLPDSVFTTSPGRCAVPDGMFSTMPTSPTASTLARRPASAAISPITAAPPAMSNFMSSMPPAGLMEMPPVSKVTPLPTKAMGFCAALAFLPPLPPPDAPSHCITAMRGSFSLPWATPRIAPIPSFFISFGPRISTCTPSFSRSRQRSAMVSGLSTLGGSDTRSRARNTPSATARIGAQTALAPGTEPVARATRSSFGLSSSFSWVR